MLMLMSTVLGLGIAVTIVLSAVLAHHFGRRVSSVREQVKEDYQQVLERADEIDRQLVKRLADGRETRESVQHWQRDRTEELPEFGWKWTKRELEKWRDRLFSDRVAKEKARVVLQAVVGLVVICVVFGGVTGVAYHNYASQGTQRASAPPLLAPPSTLPQSPGNPFPSLLPPSNP